MTAKIIRADVEDSLNVVLSYVQASKTTRVILVIPEGNDLLSSTVGLKTLHKKFQELEKEVVLVVPESFVHYAKQAGFVVATDVEAVESSHWHRVRSSLLTYQARNFRNRPATTFSKEEHKTVKQEESKYKIDSGPKIEEKPQEVKKSVPTDLKKPTKVKLTGMDFSNMLKKTPQQPAYTPVKVGAKSTEQTTNKNAKGSKFKKVMVKLVVFLLFAGLLVSIIGLAGLYFYYKYVPRVYVSLNIKTTEVELKTDVNASLSVSGLDLEKKQIGLLSEEVKKKASSTIKATQEVTSGEYATGVVQLVNASANDIVLPAGTLFTSDNGFKYKSTQEVVIPSMGNGEVSVQATEYGEDYNIDANHEFSIAIDQPGLTGRNGEAFSGGEKRTYTVVGKDDVKKGVDELKKALFKEAEDELSEINKDKGYQFIEKSVKNELDGDYKVDPPIGTEATDAYLEVNTKSQALYYHKDSLDRLAEFLLLEKYKKDNDIGKDVTLQVENLSVKVTRIDIAKDRKSVKLRIEAQGKIIPKIDKNALAQELSKKSWNDAKAMLDDLPYLKDKPVIKFEPTWIPQKFWYIPSEPNRIIVELQF